jgi:hypothetical protein
MTVSTTLNKITFPGNASATVFPFTFATPLVPADIQVFFTDASGNVTLLSPSVYTLSINPATGTDPTPVGGSVTYNPLGVPIPFGTFLTILRTLPLVQNTSLANQGTSYQQVTEQALDYEMMVSQQVLEVQSRALVVSVSDPTPNALPAVAARANLFLAFDSSGNPIASQPGGSNTPISSAMVPVVTASTLAVARTALGLGSIVTESIGLGLEDNGAGSLQTFYNHVADGSNQAVVASFHANVREATGALTYTFPLSSTLFNGFGTWIYARTAAVTLAINAADAFDGAATGASLTIPVGTRAFVSTNATGTWFIRGFNQPGFNAPLNLQLNASVSSNNLVIAVKDANGNDPSPASPVIFTVSAGGNSIPRAVTGALSITVPTGATLGTVNGQSNRIWVGVFDNAGSPVLAVYNSLNSTGPAVLAWDESTQTSATAVSAGATLPQTWYGASGITTKSFRVLGYVESTQATAGTWTSAPSKTQLFGPGIKKPGDVVQAKATVSASLAISPLAAANLIKFFGCARTSINAAFETVTYLRGATTLFTQTIGAGNASVDVVSTATVYDTPNTTGSTTYSISGAPNALAESTVELQEIFV